jgi:ribosome biogenesis GTPase A
VSGGRVDLEKASGVLLRDLRTGKLGRITLEEPDEVR